MYYNRWWCNAECPTRISNSTTQKQVLMQSLSLIIFTLAQILVGMCMSNAFGTLLWRWLAFSYWRGILYTLRLVLEYNRFVSRSKIFVGCLVFVWLMKLKFLSIISYQMTFLTTINSKYIYILKLGYNQSSLSLSKTKNVHLEGVIKWLFIWKFVEMIYMMSIWHLPNFVKKFNLEPSEITIKNSDGWKYVSFYF